jgi:hypothetical protein
MWDADWGTCRWDACVCCVCSLGGHQKTRALSSPLLSMSRRPSGHKRVQARTHLPPPNPPTRISTQPTNPHPKRNPPKENPAPTSSHLLAGPNAAVDVAAAGAEAVGLGHAGALGAVVGLRAWSWDGRDGNEGDKGLGGVGTTAECRAQCFDGSRPQVEDKRRGSPVCLALSPATASDAPAGSLPLTALDWSVAAWSSSAAAAGATL